MNPVAFFKSLADETRLRLVLLIAAEQELCVCELVAALDDTQPKVSRHLALLRSQQLLLDRRQGVWIYYRLNPQLPGWVADVIKQSLAGNEGLLAEAQQRLAAMGDRPQRLSQCC